MSGTFLLGTVPVRPGVYTRRERIGTELSSATNGVCAVLFQSDFGELNKVVSIDQTMANELEDVFGSGSVIIKEILLGGAQTVHCVRVGGDDGKASKVTLQTDPIRIDTVTPRTLTCTVVNSTKFEVPGDFDYDNFTAYSGDNDIEKFIELGDGFITLDEDAFDELVDGEFVLSWNVLGYEVQTFGAVEIESAHVGERDFTVSVRTNLITDKRQLLIYSGTDVYATFTFGGEDEAQSLVDAMKTSKLFNARKISAGKLADVTQIQMTGGKNPTVTNSHYERGTNALERYKWNCIVADSNSASVNGILSAFVRQSYETGHLGMACIAGDSSQTLEERMSYAASCNDEKIVYVLNGWVSNDGTVYDGWRASARIGGMIAGCESGVSLTGTVISDALELIEPLTNGEVTRAIEHGCLALTLNSSGQVKIDYAINTLVTPDANCDDGWKKIKRTKIRFEAVDRITASCEKLVGRVNNDSNGRGTLLATAQGVLNEMTGEGKLYEGSNIVEDESHKPQGDTAYFVLTLADIDSLEKILLTFRTSFANPFDE